MDDEKKENTVNITIIVIIAHLIAIMHEKY